MVNVVPQDVQRTLVSISSGWICFKEISSFREGVQGPVEVRTLTKGRTRLDPLLFRRNSAERGISGAHDSRFQKVRSDSDRNALKAL